MVVEETLAIYPAPAIQEATPAKESTILAMLEYQPHSSVLHFTLGNLNFRKSNFVSAIESYQQSLFYELNNPFVISNIALAYFRLANFKDCLIWAERAISLSDELILPRMLRALIFARQGKFEEAQDIIAQILVIDPNVVEAYELLASIVGTFGDEERSYRLSRQAFQRDETKRHLRDELCARKFNRGRKYFKESARIAAYAEWAEGYVHYGASFTECREIVLGMKELAREFSVSKAYRALVERSKDDIQADLLDKICFYELFLDFFFSIGLIPEVFEYRHLLEDRRRHWFEEETRDGLQPYSKFRLVVIDCYLGNLQEAKEGLLVCLDSLPDKKHHSLRLDVVYSFVSELFDAHRGKLAKRAEATNEEWLASGFATEFELASWKKTGLLPQDAVSWRENRFRPQETFDWLRHGVSLEEAIVWRGYEFKDPEEVKKWLRCGVNPEQAIAWKTVFGSDIDEVTVWLKQGFTNPLVARGWISLVRFPWEAKQWEENGFAVREARSWHKEGIKDPFEALRLKREKEALLRQSDAQE